VHKEHPCTPSLTIQKRTRGASQCGLAIFLKKKYLQAKIRIMETQNISPCKKYNLQKNPLKQTQILQDIITLIPNLKFQQHKPKNNHLSKILIKKK